MQGFCFTLLSDRKLYNEKSDCDYTCVVMDTFNGIEFLQCKVSLHVDSKIIIDISKSRLIDLYYYIFMSIYFSHYGYYFVIVVINKHPTHQMCT